MTRWLLAALLLACRPAVPSALDAAAPVDAAAAPDLSGMIPLRGTGDCGEGQAVLLVDLTPTAPRAALGLGRRPELLVDVSLELVSEQRTARARVRRHRLGFRTRGGTPGAAWIIEEIDDDPGSRFGHVVRAVGLADAVSMGQTFDVSGTVP